MILELRAGDGGYRFAGEIVARGPQPPGNHNEVVKSDETLELLSKLNSGIRDEKDSLCADPDPVQQIGEVSSVCILDAAFCQLGSH